MGESSYEERFITDLATSLNAKVEKRQNIDDPRWWPSTATTSEAGKIVNSKTATSLSAVYACVKIISETIASLPFILYRRAKDGRKEANTHPLWPVFRDKPNEQQNFFEFIEMIWGHILLRGNAFLFKELNRAGEVIGLWPLHPDNMTTLVAESQTSGVLSVVGYDYQLTQTGGKVSFMPDDIWHIKDWSDNGVLGISRIEQAANTFGASLATEEYSSKFFANSANPSGILTYPGKLKEDARTRLVNSWEGLHQGSNQASKTALLEAGIEWKPVSITPEASQLIETRQWQVADIARIFRVPTILIGGAGAADKSNTFASAEQQMLAFVQHTIRPIAIRFEQSANAEFLSDKERRQRQRLFFEFKLEGLLRGDVKSRFEAFKIGREWGWLSPNDIRAFENMPNLGKDGDEYTRPMNMQPIGTEPAKPAPEPPADEPIEDAPDDTE
jgi:HK97 family phage portal protein